MLDREENAPLLHSVNHIVSKDEGPFCIFGESYNGFTLSQKRYENKVCRKLEISLFVRK